jgi:hypothetical protein
VIRGLEAPEGLVERSAVHERIEASGLIVDANPVPPEPAQLLHEAAERDAALEEVREAALVAVEARLDRHVGQPGVLAKEPAENVGSASPRSADEDQFPIVSVV